ncbi:MAG: hypothetical protein QM398_01900 [Thermoproteota archaeon]|nr:hypothetical protein [Thermoproteota archaeon]
MTMYVISCHVGKRKHGQKKQSYVKNKIDPEKYGATKSTARMYRPAIWQSSLTLDKKVRRQQNDQSTEPMG